jgi:hypothetical protein
MLGTQSLETETKGSFNSFMVTFLPKQFSTPGQIFAA